MQPEVALTRGLWWLLGLAGAADALDPLLVRGGIEPGHEPRWLTEVVGADRGRTDLECHWGRPAVAHVVVEAKIGHTLDVGQVAAYRHRLPDSGGLLAVLVPESRRHEADRVLAEYRVLFPDESVHLDVWTYDEVTRALADRLPDSPDVAQFAGLVAASRALDISPLTEAELTEDQPGRRDDIWRVVEQASSGLFGQRSPAGTDRYFEVRRFVELAPLPTSLVVGVGRKGRQVDAPRPWAWLRISDDTAFAHVAQRVLDDLHPSGTLREGQGLGVPLQIPPGRWGAAMIDTVRDQIVTTASAIVSAIDEALASEVASGPPDLHDAMAAVLGMPPFEPADLLDDCDLRKGDIERMVLEVTTVLFGGQRLYPQVRVDPDFDVVRYVQVTPFDTHVAIASGRKEHPSGRPEPRVWIRVHNDTRHAAIAFDVLEHLAPEQVARGTVGRAIPLAIPTGTPGPETLRRVHARIDEVRSAIRAAIYAAHREDSAEITR
ncbi:hypothetical protein [Cellulomonas chitinilytica]|uniref:hypothetical protein n=1 Tax=Cellulomonas chitinilytica TaxID=398759 RepID=UPI0019430EA0|nr:hypothetical protein [Cellulomonas chitinilytica]